jgi:hypothetical protein
VADYFIQELAESGPMEHRPAGVRREGELEDSFER